MSKFDDPKEQKSVSSPHPDLGENIKFFQRLMHKVICHDPAVKYIIHDVVYDYIYDPESDRNVCIPRIKEYKNCTYSWPEKGGIMTANISFHQKNLDFRTELCKILNILCDDKKLIGKKGLTDKPPENQWTKLFGDMNGN